MITARNGDIEDLPVLSKGLKKDDFVKFRIPVEGKDYGRVLDIQGTDALVVCSNSRNNLRFSYGRTAETPLSNCLKWNITEIPAMTKKIQLNAAARLQHPLVAADVAEAGFEEWPKERQEKYLKEHPGSKYGKGGGKATPAATPVTKTPRQKEAPMSREEKETKGKEALAEYDKLDKQVERFQQSLRGLKAAYGPGRLLPEEEAELQGYKDKIAQNKKKMNELAKFLKKTGYFY